MQQAINTIRGLVEEAKRIGEIRGDADSGYIAEAISGLYCEIILN